MNVKKVIGAGLLVALVGCEQIQATAYGSAQLPVAGSQIYLVNNFQKPQTYAPSGSGPSCNNPQHSAPATQKPATIPASQPVQPVKIPVSLPFNVPQFQWKQNNDDKNEQNQQVVHNHPGGQAYGQTLDKENQGKSDDAKEDKPIRSESGHVHTPDNKAGDNPDDEGSKHSWKDKQGNPHETLEAKDKEGKYHQIHRWQDSNGRSHQTENWTDLKNNVHQCHRWQDDKGETHQAVHVTKSDGTVVSEHFAKDRDGKVRKIQGKEAESESDSGRKGLREEKESDSARKVGKDEKQSDSIRRREREQRLSKDNGKSESEGHHVGLGVSLGNAGSILHTANCVVANSNIKVPA